MSENKGYDITLSMWYNMPRQARKKSKKGIYHTMVRGIKRQIIFEDDEDYVKFIDAV